MKILIATQKPFSAIAVKGIIDIIEKAGHQAITLEKYAEKSDLIKAVEDVDALIIRSDKVDAEVLDAAKKLKIVVRAGAGVDNVDLEKASENKVVVMNTPGQNSNAVAELVLAFMIYMSRNQFNPSTGSELKGKTIGIQAFGNVGRLVADKAKALGMKVFAFDPFVNAEQFAEANVEAVNSLEELYQKSDFLSLHIPATAQTIKSINYDLINKLPKNACLINTARKEVIHEEDLAKILRDRQDLKYITDVAPDHYDELSKDFATRIFATSKKMGAQTAEANVNAGLAAAKQIIDFFEKGIVKFQVNK